MWLLSGWSTRRRGTGPSSAPLSRGYALPEAEICFDPFHVVRLGARAVDRVRRDEWKLHDRSHTPHGRWVKSTRWSLLKAPEHQSARQLATLHEVSQVNQRLYRAFLLKEEL